MIGTLEAGENVDVPRITRPTPIGVIKSPRPTDESNLESHFSVTLISELQPRWDPRMGWHVLLALFVWCAIVVEPS